MSPTAQLDDRSFSPPHGDALLGHTDAPVPAPTRRRRRRRTPRRCIVVGYDGSPASRAALDTATAPARGAKLLIVCAGGDEDRSAALLDGLLLEGHDALADLDWQTLAVSGEAAAQALVRVAAERGADEIIMGTRGLGRTRALLGSTSHEVLRTAPCPVTVVRARVS